MLIFLSMFCHLLLLSICLFPPAFILETQSWKGNIPEPLCRSFTSFVLLLLLFFLLFLTVFSLWKKKRWNWMHLTGKTGSCVYRKVRELMSNDRQRGFDSGCWRRPTTSVLFPHDRTRKYYQLGWRWLPVLRQRLATTTDNVRLTL